MMSDNTAKYNELVWHIRELVEPALLRKGVSARRASLDVVGHDGLIRDIRAGRIPGLDKIDALFAYLDLQMSLGVPRASTQAPTALIDGTEFDTIRRFNVSAAVGDGMINPEGDPVDHLAFSKRWLASQGISPGDSFLIHRAR